MDLIVLPRRLKLRKEHGMLRQPVAAEFGNQVTASGPLSIPSSERCETRPAPSVKFVLWAREASHV